ncbi:MAG: tetratricopeptide repeat protein [Bacteroidota bacterium]|nr:tetratricopeptide repeat protein [Bacteroidota bacterium]
MKKIIIIFFLTLICDNYTAQSNYDSLWNVWNNVEEPDSNRIKSLYTIVKEVYLNTNIDSALILAKKVNGLALSSKVNLHISKSYILLGAIYFRSKDYSQAITSYNQALVYAKKSNSFEEIIVSYTGLGIGYKSIGDFNNAFIYLEKSLEKSNTYKNYNKNSILNSLGNLFSEQEKYQDGLKYYKEAFDYASDEDKITIYYNIGACYIELEETQKAIKQLNNALILAKRFDDLISQIYCHSALSSAYLDTKEYTKAKINLELESNLVSNLQNDFYNAILYFDYGNYFLSKQENKSAINYFKKAFLLFEKHESFSDLLAISENLYEAYEKTNDLRNALKYYKLFVNYQNKIINDEIKEKSISQLTKHEIEKKQLIKDQKQKEAAKIARIEQLKKDAIAKKESENKNFLLITSLVIIILVIIFTIILISRLRITTKQKGIIEKQKKKVDNAYSQLEEKNLEILDSIQYAKRLQQAILPPKKLVKEWLPNSFVLYKPKDIVAGDFYWMENINEWIYFAAADCTGHGVPGAMVSVVCSNALSVALLDEGKTKPSEILNRTRELVIERFERSEEEIKDGMDISLCALNYKTGKMQWAGANNPLWIIRSGSDVIEVIRGDQQPIGIYVTSDPFHNHEIKLQKGDCIYIFTDGYPDQFGGEKNKKYKTTTLKRFLLTIQDKDMETQRKLLSKEFDNWKADFEQVDDVCVIGVKTV